MNGRTEHRLKCRYCINDKCIKHTPPTLCNDEVVCERMTHYDRKRAPISKEYHGNIAAWLKAHDPLIASTDNLPSFRSVY